MKRIILAILGAAVILMTSALPVFADSVITHARYKGIVTVSNSSSAADNVSVNVSISTPSLISSGYINATATDAAWRGVGATDVPFMPGYGTNPWIFWVPTASGGAQSNTFYTSNVTSGSLVYFPGTAGMSSAHSASTDLGSSNFTFEISAFFDGTATGTYPVNKTSDYFYLVIDSANHFTAVVSSTTLNSAFTTGVHDVKIVRNGTSVTLVIDDSVKDTQTATDFTGESHGWTYGASGSTPYINFVSLTINTVLQQYLAWNYGATFADLSTKGHDATPSFRTTSSNANVSASLTSFQPSTQAAISSFTVGSTGGIALGSITTPSQMYTDVGTSNISGMPGADIVNAVLDGGSADPVDQATTRSLFWYLCVFIGISVVALLSYEATTMMATKNYDLVQGPLQYQRDRGIKFVGGAKDGSLLFAGVIMEFALILFSYWGVIPGLCWQMFLIPLLLLMSMKPETKTY